MNSIATDTKETKTFSTASKSETNVSFWDRMIPNLEFNRYSIISMLILIIGCLGGITVGMGAIHSVFQIALVVFPTMLGLALILGVAPMKHIMSVCAVAVVIDIILLVTNLLG